MIRLLLGLGLALTGALAVAGTSAAAGPVDPPAITMVSAPTVKGERVYGRTMRVGRGAWSPGPSGFGYQWLRDGEPIPGATGRRHRAGPADVGHRLTVVVTASAPGYAPTSTTVKVGRIKHRVPVRRTVRYSVRVRGAVSGGVGEFKRLAQETLDDPRGWRARGVRFKRVARGGTFTLWLAQARLVPSFSSACSAQWSCRVGRNVIINVDRWRHASPAWNAAGRSLRDYRHMVLNHETGHWIGFGHASCPRRGAIAPVMMQQSKGTGGCRFNPWPTRAELRRR